ncbi:serine hydrolase [Streptomyces sp. HF10]|uniref:serine hydrolase n=1 Tax=Streptomyces sp. HF10 TaxID=2692233 RepID=UPI001916C353|nr:serine hydrolase [Streptomyces sp. HF10]
MVLLAAPLSAARAPDASRACGTHEAVRRSVHRLVAEDRIAGAAVLVDGPAAGPGCARWSVTYGAADLRTGRLTNTTDRLRIGSVTKTFTATVVLQLAAEHRLSLDAPVERCLPGLIRGHGYDGRRITVRQLLQHTSGLPDCLEALIPTLVLNGLSQDLPSAYGDFAQGVRELRRAAGGEPVSPSPWLAGLLQFLLTGHDSAYGSAQTAILCGDGTAPRDPETYWRDLRQADPRDRFFAPVTNDINPCAFWGPPRERPTTVRADLPALLVNATGDPRTLYSGAERVHRGWPGSRLITLHDADQHAVFGIFGSACVDDAVNAYLATDRLPAVDLSCPRGRP